MSAVGRIHLNYQTPAEVWHRWRRVEGDGRAMTLWNGALKCLYFGPSWTGRRGRNQHEWTQKLLSTGSFDEMAANWGGSTKTKTNQPAKGEETTTNDLAERGW